LSVDNFVKFKYSWLKTTCSFVKTLQNKIKLKKSGSPAPLNSLYFPKQKKDSLDTYSNLNLMKICHVVYTTLNYDVGINFKYFLCKIWGVWSFEKLQIFKFSMYSKNTKTLKDSLDTYLNLMKICHVVLKTLNYDVGIHFKYFLWKIWGVWSFETRQIFKLSLLLLWFTWLYK